MPCSCKTQDFPTLADAINDLKVRGFEKASYRDEHYRHPTRQDDGYWQRADAFVPHNMSIGRLAFWPANA